MKKFILLGIVSVLAGMVLNLHAQLLFSDGFNYSDGLVETDGFWFCYSPATPHQDAFVNDHLLILNSTNYDSVAAPFTNNTGNSLVFASFTINVTKLPSTGGGYFAVLMQHSNDVDVADVGHVFIDRENTVVPGTYQLGIADFANSITVDGATNFPMDLATGITYQVVFSFDPNNNDPLTGATLWINPSSEGDLNVYGNGDDAAVASTAQLSFSTQNATNAIGFSQFTGAEEIGNVMVGLNFSDVDAAIPQLPVIGVQPQGETNYSGNPFTLYTAASGIDVTYQWLANGVALTDNGVTVVGSQSNVLNLTNLQASANYSVVASDSAGSVTSDVAVVSIDTTPTLPFFTSVPPNQTNTLGQGITLTVAASGTGPISYQWYFAAIGSNTTNLLFGVNKASYGFTAATNNSGYYYVKASNSAGSTNSPVFFVTAIPPVLVSIAYMHTFLTNDDNLDEVANGQEFEVQGVVTTIGNIYYSSVSTHPAYALFFIQDGTGGTAVFDENGSSNNPPAGALVNVVSPAESYYGELEMAPYQSGTITIISSNNPLPAPQLMNMANMQLMASNAFGVYGSNIQCSVVSLTNVYLSTSATTYTAPTGTFPTNGSYYMYAWPSTTSYPGETNLEVYVYTYTNVNNQLNTNYWGKPIPSFCYELTGIIGLYSPTEAQLYPTRYADFVTSPPASFRVGITKTNSTPTVTWPAAVGSTYSLYSANSLLGPWTQTFGLSYYPSVGAYTDTNAAPAKFYRVSSP
ncbi:MAG: immunoglobulin domain-containing protein [Verrucomicrobiia bacterium]